MEDIHLGLELVPAEELEDRMESNALGLMQEMSQAPFGQFGMSKEEYARIVQQIEEEEER